MLADALHVVAREHGHRSWPAFKHAAEAAGGGVRPVYRIGAFGHEEYEEWADRLLAAARAGDRDALARLRAARARGSRDDATRRRRQADARVCLAREYGFRTWDELAEATDRARDTHYSRLPADLPWKRAEAAIRAGDAAALRALLDEHPGLEHEDPGMTLIVAAAQPEAGDVPREVVDVLIEAGSELDDALGIAACFNKPDMVGWLLDAGADPHAHRRASRRCRPPPTTAPARPPTCSSRAPGSSPTPSTSPPPPATSTAWRAGSTATDAAPGGQRDRPNLTDVGMPGRADPRRPGRRARRGARARRPPRPHRGLRVPARPRRRPGPRPALRPHAAALRGARAAAARPPSCSSPAARRSTPATASTTTRRSTGRATTASRTTRSSGSSEAIRRQC